MFSTGAQAEIRVLINSFLFDVGNVYPEGGVVVQNWVVDVCLYACILVCLYACILVYLYACMLVYSRDRVEGSDLRRKFKVNGLESHPADLQHPFP